ncbi:MAG: carboxypeptidase-like regulatory domain-containing protein [Calditrichaeota bacterium]|nr:MAG: carboxypeptidase-like regulatory domain-containing protein [Calditrichota bacterium]
MQKLITLIILIFTFPNFSIAKNIIKGKVVDSKSNLPLTAASVLEEGTFNGSIANEFGEFFIVLNSIPATLQIDYIGYESQKIQVKNLSQKFILIELEPTQTLVKPVIITTENPANRIMREVIKRKKMRLEGILSYKNDAYSRIVIENDEGIVSILEVISEINWDKEKGSVEVIKSKKQTNNIDPSINSIEIGNVPNFYEDDVEIMENNMICPTNPKAFDYYKFQLIGERSFAGKTVYDIQVIPNSKLQPLLQGTLAVLDEDFILLEVSLKPSKYVIFPTPIKKFDLTFTQQFRNFGEKYWLPVDLRTKGEMHIGITGFSLPPIKFSQVSSLKNYELNVQIPETLFVKDRTVLEDSVSVSKSDSIFAENVNLIPYTQEEQIAYEEIDSTLTLQKAFKPKGALAKLVNIEVEANDEKVIGGEKNGKNFLDRISPNIAYNRVDEGKLGIKLDLFENKKTKIDVLGGYSTGLREGFYGSDFQYKFGKENKWVWKNSFYQGSVLRFKSFNYAEILNSVQNLIGFEDYFGYFKNQKFSTALGFKNDFGVEVGLNVEKHTSLEKNTDFDLFGRSLVQRKNPSIFEGNLRSVQAKFEFGDDFTFVPIAEQNNFEVRVEHSQDGFLGSDFDFTKVEFRTDFRVLTFLKRRFLPNALDVRLQAGISRGKLPPQRFFAFDGVLVALSPFGTFKTLKDNPYEGDKYVSVFWEHNFRTVPFELIGLNWFAKKGLGIILHGASGKTWFKKENLSGLDFAPNLTNGVHHEIGLSLNGIFDFARIDFTQRLDKKDFRIGVSVARMF